MCIYFKCPNSYTYRRSVGRPRFYLWCLWPDHNEIWHEGGPLDPNVRKNIGFSYHGNRCHGHQNTFSESNYGHFELKLHMDGCRKMKRGALRYLLPWKPKCCHSNQKLCSIWPAVCFSLPFLALDLSMNC